MPTCIQHGCDHDNDVDCAYLQKEIKANLVYDLKRYSEDYSPMCVYIPNRPLMFKMMKACIGVERVQDLWMYCKTAE